jgi:tetratricopeptide (TPR) repeat protein
MADRRFDEAADAFERAAKQQQGSAVYHFWLGQAYGAQAQQANVLRQPSLARRTKQEFERAVQLDPDYLDARAGLMQFYLLAPGLMGGSVDKAREQAAEVRRRDPYRGAFLAASIAQRQKDVAGAMREYQAISSSTRTASPRGWRWPPCTRSGRSGSRRGASSTAW